MKLAFTSVALLNASIYQVPTDRLGITSTRDVFDISTDFSDSKFAAILFISPSSPLLVLDRVHYVAQDSLLERAMHYLLPDDYRLKVGVHVNRRD